MTQLAFTLHTPSAASLTRLRQDLASYQEAVETHAALAAALPSVEANTTLSATSLAFAKVRAIDAKHGVHNAAEWVREDLYEVETGKPGREAWNVKPLEDFKAVLQRAMALMEGKA